YRQSVSWMSPLVYVHFLIRCVDRTLLSFFFFFQAEDGIRDATVTGVQTCALPISLFSASEGLLVYAPTFATASQLVWFDRNGKPIGSLGDPGLYLEPRISPDGGKVAVDVLDLAKNTSEIWIYDASTGVGSKFVFGAWSDFFPVWSPAGDRLIFASDRK